jgi:hypothetical protein
MTLPNPEDTDKALEDQDDYEEIVEIDEFGRVYRPNQAPRNSEKKPTILRDPKGEYV